MLTILSILVWGHLHARYSQAILVSEEQNMFDSVHGSTNSSADVWSCLRFKYQEETMEELGTSMTNCARRNLYKNLVDNMEADCVDLGDGVSVMSNDQQVLTPRERENFYQEGTEPPTFRRILDGYSTFLGHRGLRWDLGHLYPGLVMRIGPSMNGAGTLEFIMEKRLDYHDRSKLAPGQLIVRRTILPHLLGFRMNLLSLLPIVFGILIFVAKNAYVFSKVTLVLSTLLTLKSLFMIQHLRPQHHSPHFPDTGGGIAHDPVTDLGIRPRPQGHSLFGLGNDNVLLSMINSGLPPFRGVNDDERTDAGQRNFSWEKRK